MRRSTEISVGLKEDISVKETSYLKNHVEYLVEKMLMIFFSTAGAHPSILPRNEQCLWWQSSPASDNS